MSLLRILAMGWIASVAVLPARAGDLGTLQSWMTGSFSSEEQAHSDESYFDIRLEMVPIWTERKDGPWLYVEQAAATNLERPYRQRVYRLSKQKDGTFRSEVYALPDDPLRFAGAWREPDRLQAIGPDDLALRECCAVILNRESKSRFAGSTVDKQCKSSLRGATYATSRVVVTATEIRSWDRGFSDADEQVWGAEKGPYIFSRSPGSRPPGR